MLRAHLGPPRPLRATGSAVNQFCTRIFCSASHPSTMHPGPAVLCSATVDAASQPQAEPKPEEAQADVEPAHNILSDVAERLVGVRVSGEPLPGPAATALAEPQGEGPGAAGQAPPAPPQANQPDQPKWSITNLPVDASRHTFGWSVDFRKVDGYAAAGVAPFAYRPEEGELYVLLSLQSKTKGEMAALAKGGGRGRGKGRGGTAPGRGPGGKAKAGEGGSDATLKKELEEGGFALPGRLVYTFLGGKVEPSDGGDARATAAREAYEESHMLLGKQDVLRVLLGEQPACTPHPVEGAGQPAAGPAEGAEGGREAGSEASGAAGDTPVAGGASVAGVEAGAPGADGGAGAVGGGGAGEGGGGGLGGCPHQLFTGRYTLFAVHLPGAWHLPELCAARLRAGQTHPEAIKAVGLEWVPLRVLKHTLAKSQPAASSAAGGRPVMPHHFMAALLRARKGVVSWLVQLRDHLRQAHGFVNVDGEGERQGAGGGGGSSSGEEEDGIAGSGVLLRGVHGPGEKPWSVAEFDVEQVLSMDGFSAGRSSGPQAGRGRGGRGAGAKAGAAGRGPAPGRRPEVSPEKPSADQAAGTGAERGAAAGAAGAGAAAASPGAETVVVTAAAVAMPTRGAPQPLGTTTGGVPGSSGLGPRSPDPSLLPVPALLPPPRRVPPAPMALSRPPAQQGAAGGTAAGTAGGTAGATAAGAAGASAPPNNPWTPILTPSVTEGPGSPGRNTAAASSAAPDVAPPASAPTQPPTQPPTAASSAQPAAPLTTPSSQAPAELPTSTLPEAPSATSLERSTGTPDSNASQPASPHVSQPAPPQVRESGQDQPAQTTASPSTPPTQPAPAASDPRPISPDPSSLPPPRFIKPLPPPPPPPPSAQQQQQQQRATELTRDSHTLWGLNGSALPYNRSNRSVRKQDGTWEKVPRSVLQTPAERPTAGQQQGLPPAWVPAAVEQPGDAEHGVPSAALTPRAPWSSAIATASSAFVPESSSESSSPPRSPERTEEEGQRSGTDPSERAGANTYWSFKGKALPYDSRTGTLHLRSGATSTARRSVLQAPIPTLQDPPQRQHQQGRQEHGGEGSWRANAASADPTSYTESAPPARQLNGAQLHAHDLPQHEQQPRYHAHVRARSPRSTFPSDSPASSSFALTARRSRSPSPHSRLSPQGAGDSSQRLRQLSGHPYEPGTGDSSSNSTYLGQHTQGLRETGMWLRPDTSGTGRGREAGQEGAARGRTWESRPGLGSRQEGEWEG